MALPISGQVGPSAVNSGDGANIEFRQGKTGDIIASELHGRFFEQVYRGNVFGWGKTITALSANSISLTATTTPLIGVWNPASSLVNLVILQASMWVAPNTVTTPAAPGVFVWAASTGNGGISTGNTPWNRKSLAQSGSAAKAFDLATALTGLTNNIVIFDIGDFQNPGAITPFGTLASTTITSNFSVGGVQNFDGSLIVPPGGVLALLNTTSTTAFSAVARLMWEEVLL
jgi:hypothetical protein